MQSISQLRGELDSEDKKNSWQAPHSIVGLKL